MIISAKDRESSADYKASLLVYQLGGVVTNVVLEGREGRTKVGRKSRKRLLLYVNNKNLGLLVG